MAGAQTQTIRSIAPAAAALPSGPSAQAPGEPRYLNRELGVLAFNERVLAMAEDPSVPLLERMRFLCIVSNNLDEFFEVRVAWLKQQIVKSTPLPGPDGLPPSEALRRVSERCHALVARQYGLYNRILIPAMEAEGITMLRRERWTRAQQAWAKEYFETQMRPVLTPIGLDPAHPFPRVLNKSLNFAVELEGPDAFGRDVSIAIVQAPRVLPRVIGLPEEVARVPHGFITLGAILRRFVGELFPGMEIRSCDEFRVTRNSELYVDEEEMKNLRVALQGELLERHFGDAVRLEVSDTCTASVSSFLMQQFGLGELDLYRVDGPVNLVRLNQIPDLVERAELKYPPFVPSLPALGSSGAEPFVQIAHGDVLVHHPFQSFQPVLDFLRAAAIDPAVVAIKQTIYRTGSESALMETLIEAARNGKEVTVVVELLARFDEEANINWASRLEEVGAHVVYGIVGFKTHAKFLLVVRREQGRLRRYVHLSTGNYHARTARLYTDFGLFTAHPELCNDVSELFTQMTGIGRAAALAHLWQSPFTLHQGVLRSIEEETRRAGEGQAARIIAKMNALLEPEVIDALYRASQAGVRVDLIVRGVCALRPGLPGLSERIRVRSIVGRFLEHTRVFYFLAGGEERVYLSSADWMGRNFFGRVEVCFPILDPALRRRVIREGLKEYLVDTENAWCMGGAGEYLRARDQKGRRHCAQTELLKRLADRV